MATYVFPYLGLVIENAKFNDGVLQGGFVVNGHWELRRNGDKWECCSTDWEYKHFPVVSTKDVGSNDNIGFLCPREYIDDYNAALDWANEKLKEQDDRVYSDESESV